MKQEYIQKINSLMVESEDVELLDFILQLMQKSKAV